ncbi:hypothetical protein [uncultured Shimia sp.]|uniref:hypothetical protein n=1 Tax=uncultured Shimia sp. TaxID=573152 RepID=UPI00262944AE|nr:hypothetical protein [uncultured Shimia sp.]
MSERIPIYTKQGVATGQTVDPSRYDMRSIPSRGLVALGHRVGRDGLPEWSRIFVKQGDLPDDTPTE